MDAEHVKGSTKISGYLEKKGRKKMMSCYKKYWFVLEGKLLLYYRSKEEYEAISPCKGSINMGPTCNVKPCCLRVGVFQIVSRTTTITLRAESREEQHKWMQAIMNALNQHNTPTRLGYFRYSLGELTPEPKRLERQNTMPERVGRPKSCGSGSIGFIEKLQRIGAQNYGGFSGRSSTKPNQTPNEQPKSSLCEDSTISENGKYETCCKKISISDCDSINCSFDDDYERIPPREVLRRNSHDPQTKKPTKNRSISLLTNSTNQHKKDLKKRPNSLAVCDQTTYCDDENCSINSNTNNCNKIEDYLSTYTEPRYEEIDFNKNSVSPKNLQNNGRRGSVGFWTSELDFLEKDTQQSCGKNSKNGSYESLNDEKPNARKFKGFGKTKIRLIKSTSEEKKINIKKSESFLRRVWNKKYRNKKKAPEIKREEKNNEDNVQDLVLPPLNILQDVVNEQNNQEKVNKKNYTEKESVQTKSMEVLVNEEVRYENLDVLRRKSGLPSPQQEPITSGPPLPPRGYRSHDRTSVLPHDIPKLHNLENIKTPCTSEIIQKISLEEIMQDIETTNEIIDHECEVKENITPKKGKINVKDLIKKFSSEQYEIVELRQRNPQNRFIYERDSSELNRLLDELAKVTTAPIMTPGATSSLVNPEISDEELVKLVPIRKRRTSDPDYDVPRSYQSLANLPTKTEDCDLRGTRFFGPILTPCDIHNMSKDQEPPSPGPISHCPSITPDSLEMEHQFRKTSKYQDNELSVSYHSHDYLSFTNSHHKIEYLSEDSHDNEKYDFAKNKFRNGRKYYKEVIYDTPKNIIRKRNDRYNSLGAESNESVFIDSLETYPQVGSTAF